MRFIHARALIVCFALVPFAALAATGPVRPSASPTGEAGPANAPVTMVVFSDFACPYSAQMFFALEKMEARYPTQLHVILKQSPLPMHVDAPRAHRAALAAGRQDKFTAMAELLYANQNKQDLDSLLGYARQLHLDMARFRRDLGSPAIAAAVDADVEEGRAFGINSTPTVYLNGKVMIGSQTEAGLNTAIASAASSATTVVASAPEAEGAPLDAALVAEMQALPAAEQGSVGAPLTIVEFTDFQCPFCRAAVEPMEKLMASRGREVRWVLRSFPLDFHPDSELANEAVLAAAEQGKFWPMHDLLFANQNALKLADLRNYAQQLSLDMTKFDEGLATHRFAGRIAADRALGARAGVSGTPTFVIDGRLVTGVRTLPELNQIADAHVRGAAGQPAVVAAQTVTPKANAGHPVSGAANAALTLTWFTDVRSPLAARQAELVRALMGRYGDRLRVLYRAFPVAAHEDSPLGAAALLAALQQGKFWEMFDVLDERRDVLDRAKMMALATSLHLDGVAFGTALDAAASAVSADGGEAMRRGIQGAPVFFLNAQRVDGLQRQEIYTAILDGELKREPAQQASVAAP